MRFKQNLPVLLVVLSAAGALALWLASAPSDRDLLRAAVTEHLKTLPGPVAFDLVGDVADVRLPDGRAVFLLFEKPDGAWRFAADLGKEFGDAVKRPELAHAVADRLGRALQDRFGGEVVLNGGMEFESLLGRELDGVVGRMTVMFAYGGGRRGRYVERFRRENGRWESQGRGSLFDSAPVAK